MREMKKPLVFQGFRTLRDCWGVAGIKRPRPDSNRGITVLQTVALPLGDEATPTRTGGRDHIGRVEPCQPPVSNPIGSHLGRLQLLPEFAIPAPIFRLGPPTPGDHLGPPSNRQHPGQTI